MKMLSSLIAAAALCVAVPALAQPRDAHDQGHGKSASHAHKRGEKLAAGDRGARVSDYKSHHLSAPPKGHEWRKVDNDYVLVAVATGVITSVIAASH